MKFHREGELRRRPRIDATQVTWQAQANELNLDPTHEFSDDEKELIKRFWEEKIKKIEKMPSLEVAQRYAAIVVLAEVTALRTLLEPEVELHWTDEQKEFFLDGLGEMHDLAKQHAYAMKLPLEGLLKGYRVCQLLIPNDPLFHNPPTRSLLDRFLNTPKVEVPKWKLEPHEVEPILKTIESCVRNPESNILELHTAGEGILFFKTARPDLRPRLLALSQLVMDRPARDDDPLRSVEYMQPVVLAFPELREKFPLEPAHVPPLRARVKKELDNIRRNVHSDIMGVSLASYILDLYMAGAKEVGVRDNAYYYAIPKPALPSQTSLPERTLV